MGINRTGSIQSTHEMICSEEEIPIGNRTLRWQDTPVGETALPEDVCLDEYDEVVTRTCGLVKNIPTWSTLQTHCVGEYVVSTVTADLYKSFKQIYNGAEVDLSQITTFFDRFDEFEIVDYIILFKLLHVMRNHNISYLQILTNMLSNLRNKYALDLSDEMFGIILDSIGELMTNKSLAQDDVKLSSSNILLRAWKPFRSNITGIALYNYTENNYLKSSVVYIYANQSYNDINTKNLETAAYVPCQFLEKLLYNSTNEVKENIYILMMLVNDNTFSDWDLYAVENISNIISVTIPNFCKNNVYPLMQAFFSPSREDGWIEFGAEYFDSSDDPLYTCVLSQFSYVGYMFSPGQNNYFESVKHDYCLPAIITHNTSKIYLEQVPTGRVAYPQNFCIGENGQIPKLLCKPNNNFDFSPISDKECTNKDLVSNYTNYIYKMATKCWNIKETERIYSSILDKNELTYVDKMILFEMTWCLFYYRMTTGVNLEGDNFVANLYDKCYTTVTDIPQIIPNLVHESYPLRFYYDLINFEYISPYSTVKPYFIYFVTVPFIDHILGLVLYKVTNGSSFLSNEIKYITPQNASQNFAHDSNVELIAYISNKSFNRIFNNLTAEEKVSTKFIVTVLYNYDLSKMDHRIKTRVVGVHKRSSRKISGMEIKIYLRILQDSSLWGVKHDVNEGHWTTVKLKEEEIIFAFVSENEGDKCEGADKVTTLQITNIENYKVSRSKLKKRKAIDIISQVSMSVNNAESETNIEKVYHKHSVILKTLMHTGGGLSCLGIFIIFMSALFLKDWHKKRFYSIQLSIALACENTYFVIKSSNIPPISYIFFYFCILAQFTWMTIIGYTQYVKFIEIFKESRLGVWKSLAIGWLTPAIITAVSVAIYKDCFNCKLCVRNSNIFMYFVLTPVCLVIVANLTIYVCIIINISRSRRQRDSSKASTNRKRAIFLLAFMLGISWTFIFALVSPWTWLTLTGWYLFHIIAPSQGFILFIFIVALDDNTIQEWRVLYNTWTRSVKVC